MLVKNGDLSLLNSSGIMLEKSYLAEKNLKGKNVAITESLTGTRLEKFKETR